MSLYDELKQLQEAFQARPVGYESLARLVTGVEVLIERHSDEAGAQVPSGWYAFGTHAGWTPEDLEGLDLQFSQQVDEAGLPLWERRV